MTPASNGTIGRIELPVDAKGSALGVVYSGLISVPKDGIYTFHVNANAGGRLYIEKHLVVDNPGLRFRRMGEKGEIGFATTERAGCIKLKAGQHPVKLHYYGAGGKKSITVTWEIPEGGEESIPDQAFYTDAP